MAITETIRSDLIGAMKEKNLPVKAVTQILSARFKNEEISLKRPLTEEEALALVRKELKQTQDSLLDAKKANSDTAEYEAQAAYLASLLPAAMSAEEIAKQVASLAAAAGATNKGEVMRAVMATLKGKADGKEIAAAVDEYLRQNG